MRSDLFSADKMDQPVTHAGISLQNSKMLKIALNGEVMARRGAMVAYQGQVQFQGLGAGGVGKWLKSKVTGEGVPIMKITGQGEVFLADNAADIFIIDLDGSDALSINGANVLAFDPTLQFDINMVQGMGMLSASGLFNCVFHGTGRIAITTKGTPVVLQVNKPTFADPQAAVCWSASLQTGFHKADNSGLGALIGRSSGEAFTMSFAGQGFVVVQPSEQPSHGLVGGAGSGQAAGSGGLGALFGG